MIRIVFIRHGATAGNLEKRYIGRTDEPLCELGISQVETLKEAAFHPDKLFVSPMLRTRQTAEILFPQMAYTTVKDMTETDFGIFEGKTADELSTVVEYQIWVDSWCQGAIPQGESTAAFKKRCCKAFDKTIQTVLDDTTVVFVVHGGTIMAILEEYARPQKDFYSYHISNGAYISCTYENGVITVNS